MHLLPLFFFLAGLILLAVAGFVEGRKRAFGSSVSLLCAGLVFMFVGIQDQAPFLKFLAAAGAALIYGGLFLEGRTRKTGKALAMFIPGFLSEALVGYLVLFVCFVF